MTPTAKIFVLDTNVLLHDPQAIFKFEENTVVIPIYVIEEVDNFKKELNERGRNARQLARSLDELRETGASLQDGVALEDGGQLIVAVPDNASELWKRRDNKQMDSAIMGTALGIHQRNPDRQVVFVTMDSNLRIRADAIGLKAENYKGGRLRVAELYAGSLTIDCDKEFVDRLGKKEEVEGDLVGLPEDIHPNAGIVLRDEQQPRHTSLGRYDADDESIRPLRVGRMGAWGIRPRNLEQTFALDVLLDPDVHLVTLVGKAGTGKTLLAVAAGLQTVLEAKSFERLVVSRPIFPLGRDVGYLPGTLEEKLNPWMQPIFDNLEYIFGAHRRLGNERDYRELLSDGTVQIEPLTYIRGRSLPNQYLIVDEAQNLTPHEVKTVITRAGANTKIVLTGDPDQIDNPYVDSASNGLTIVAERFKGERIGAHITLFKGERSELAERATRLL